MKRVVLEPARWELLPLPGDAQRAARWFLEHQGALYDWHLVLGFVAWAIPQKASRWTCSEAVAAAAGFPEPARFDPCILRAAVARFAPV